MCKSLLTCATGYVFMIPMKCSVTFGVVVFVDIDK